MDAYISIVVSKSKADIYHEGKVTVIAKTGTELCPVANLSMYLLSGNINVDSECYIFRAVTFFKSSSSYRLRSADSPLSYSTVRDVLKAILLDVSIDSKHFGIHSLRSGGVTATNRAIVYLSIGWLCILFNKHVSNIYAFSL